MGNGITHRHIRRIWLCGVVLFLLTMVRPVSPSIAEDMAVIPHNIEVDNNIVSGQTTFTHSSISIPTYPYADYLSDQTNILYNMTYPVLDWAAYEASPRTPVDQDYELLILEHDYIKVTILPELGGRIYQFIDKTTGHNHFYQNSVI